MTRIKLTLAALLVFLSVPGFVLADGGRGHARYAAYGNGNDNCGYYGCGGYGAYSPYSPEAHNYTDYRNSAPWFCPPYEPYKYSWRQFPSGDGGYVTPGNNYLPLYSSYPGNDYHPYGGGYAGYGYYR